jgi:two-component sensor histidine kinase
VNRFTQAPAAAAAAGRTGNLNDNKDILRNADRLAALNGTGLLDSAPEEAFDRITRLVAHLLDTPLSLVSLVDADRQFFKSAQGLPEPLATTRQMPLSHSFCQHVVIGGAPLIVNEATQHAAVRENPAVSEYGMMAYLGVPIRSKEGHVIGSLCAVDTKPRQWTKSELTALQDIAEILKSEIDLRREIDERRAAEQQQQLLIRELNHRVRNTLASAQSVVQLSLRAGGDVEAMKASINARIGALSRVHTTLSEKQWGPAPIADIIGPELAFFGADGRVTLEGPPLAFATDQAVALVMAIHELAANAVRHGALSVPEGRVALNWSVIPGDAGNAVFINWIESGGPLVGAPKSEGLGTALLRRLVEGPLGGVIALDYAATGLRARLTAKI